MKDKIKLDWGIIAKYGFILLAITVVCTLLLALTNRVTEPVIAKQEEQKNIEAQQNVLPQANKFKKVKNLDEIKKEVGADGDIIESVDEAYQNDTLVGYAVKTTPNGYGGEIQMLTGIGTDGKISGISILEQSETAGLGARSAEEDFQAQYRGLNAKEPVEVEKNGELDGNEIEAISGATITSTAVTRGVNTSADAVDKLEGDK